MRSDIRYDMLELRNAFRVGFFSDGVVRALLMYKSSGMAPIEESIEKKQLTKAYEFLEMVEKGEEQVDTGRLQSNAVDSIGAYRRSLSAFNYHRSRNEDFKAYIANMKSGIDSLLKSEEVNEKQIEAIERFFSVISEFTFIETEQLLEKSEGIPKWIPGSMMP